jgi:hypothetical protein
MSTRRLKSEVVFMRIAPNTLLVTTTERTLKRRKGGGVVE